MFSEGEIRPGDTEVPRGRRSLSGPGVPGGPAGSAGPRPRRPSRCDVGLRCLGCAAGSACASRSVPEKTRRRQAGRSPGGEVVVGSSRADGQWKSGLSRASPGRERNVVGSVSICSDENV